MKSIIIYGTFEPDNRVRASRYTAVRNGGRLIFIRTEIKTGDAQRALKKSTPLTGETLLNTMEIPE